MSVNGKANGARRNGAPDDKVRVAIVGVGNCASSFVQGVEYYKDADPAEQVPGLMHVDLGGYHVSDIEFTAAFDIDADKVGKDLSEAIWSGQNNTMKFSDVPNLGVKVHRGMTHDGLGKYLKQKIKKAPGETADIVGILQDTQTDVLVCYLPVGSEQATKWYVEQALAAGVGFVNCLPVFIAREDYWDKRFKEAGLPIIGDDIKSQVGATIVHRQLARLFADRGVRMERTSQLNVGGNMDFYNMLERERLESKKISKTNAVTSIMDHELPADDVYIGPSDYVPWLTDRKWAHIRVEGKSFGDVPLNVELKLEVWDSPNSAGIVIDAVRTIKLALNHGISGQLDGPSSYLMKSPHNQRPDAQAREDTEDFIDKYARQRGLPEASKARRRRPRARSQGEGGGLARNSARRRAAPSAALSPPRHLCCAGSAGLSIAQVSPHPWEARHEITEFVRRTSEELVGRGHRVLVLAPSEARAAVRESRKAMRAASEDPSSLFSKGEPRVLAIGQSIPLPTGRGGGRRRSLSTSTGRSRGCWRRSRSTSSTCTSRSPRVPARRRCATRIRSTSRPSTSPRSGCSPPRWRGCWWRPSSGGSMPARRAARRPGPAGALLPRRLRADPAGRRGGRAGPGEAPARAGQVRPHRRVRSGGRCGCSCGR